MHIEGRGWREDVVRCREKYEVVRPHQQRRDIQKYRSWIACSTNVRWGYFHLCRYSSLRVGFEGELQKMARMWIEIFSTPTRPSLFYSTDIIRSREPTRLRSKMAWNMSSTGDAADLGHRHATSILLIDRYICWMIGSWWVKSGKLR